MRIVHVAVALSLITPAVAAGQQKPRNAIDRGSMLVGGSASLSRTTIEDFSETIISVAPELLYFVRPGAALGGAVGVSYSQMQGGGSDWGWRVGPAVRWFFAQPDSVRKALPFVGANVGLAGNRTDLGGGDNITGTGWTAEGSAGITWMVSRQVGLTGTLYLDHVSSKASSTLFPTSETTSATNYGLRFGFDAFVF
ncbi:MAG TPA: hypothetical protein VJ867_09145 [Gemmatimonadaceae bacterium]|nr:hypothetical protein [Gemmatimonadaceae bacterium]